MAALCALVGLASSCATASQTPLEEPSDEQVRIAYYGALDSPATETDSPFGEALYGSGDWLIQNESVEHHKAAFALGPKPDDASRDTTAGPRLQVHTAELVGASRDAADAAEATARLAESEGGQVVERSNTFVLVKVPAARFRAFLNASRELGDIVSENIEIADVTLEARLLTREIRIAQAVRDRLRALLDLAESAQLRLTLEMGLARIEEELYVKGQRYRRLQESAAFSTIGIQWIRIDPDLGGDGATLPFEWLDTLGLDGLSRTEEP